MTKRTAVTAASAVAASPERKRTRASYSTAAQISSPSPAAGMPPTPESPAPKNSRCSVKKEETRPPATIKKEDPESPQKSPSKPKQSTSEKKLASYKAFIKGSPFPDHPLPTAEEAERVAWILGDFHGFKRESEGGRGLPKYKPPKAEKEEFGGCGDVASVLEATVRTVLSCNTSNKNSAAAHKSLTEHFGVRNWEGIMDAKESEVVDAIRCGGLANNKAKTIQGILRETYERHSVLSLDHLHSATDDEIMRELVSFNGVGPKVASCVLAFCIGRQSMAVDTHVFRLCRSLGWVPEKANRDQTYYHLHERVPGHLKYPLHVLLIKHGKMCDNCSAKGFATVKEQLSESSEEESAEVKAVKKEIKEENGVVEHKPSKKSTCPLKAERLLGKRSKAHKFKGVKKEEDADITMEEKDVSGTPALDAAQQLSSAQLLKLLQTAKSTRSKNPISDDLKKKRFTLELASASELAAEQGKRVFSIFEANMKAMYRNSSLGWKPAEKKRELFHESCRYLILRPPDVGAKIAGFAMWRFDTEIYDPNSEDRIEIAYLYEIQVEKKFQRDGLGSELMENLHDIAEQTKMRKVLLTVFNANKAARAFYDRKGYTIDAISPQGLDFEIMSKPTTSS